LAACRGIQEVLFRVCDRFFTFLQTQYLQVTYILFYGTSENAVKTQIWIGVCVYVLVAIVKKRLRLNEFSLYTILQILSVTLLKKPLLEVLTQSQYNKSIIYNDNQLKLFDY